MKRYVLLCCMERLKNKPCAKLHLYEAQKVNAYNCLGWKVNYMGNLGQYFAFGSIRLAGSAHPPYV